MLKVILCALLFLGCLSSVSAQNKLVLLKKDRVVYRFEEENIFGSSAKMKMVFGGVITGIHPNFFRIETDTTYTYDIAKIDLRGKNYTGFKIAPIGRGIIFAGVGLFLIDVFNTTVILDDSYAIDNSVTPVALAFIGTGALMQVVNNNFFKIGRRKKVATMIHESDSL